MAGFIMTTSIAIAVSLLSTSIITQTDAFPVSPTVSPRGGIKSTSAMQAHWMDFLKFDENPQYDVLAKTKEYVGTMDIAVINSYRSDDYVFRGPIIGPITAKDVRETQEGFNVFDAYSDFKRDTFGFTIDPKNPYRCLFFERWSGINTGSIKIGETSFPPTNQHVEVPIHTSSVTWNPDGKVIYEAISPPVDRFEGTTKGAGAIFGLLVGGGLDPGTASVGLTSLRIQQRLAHAIGTFGRNWSKEEDIPSWWKSKAKGADPNDI